MTNEQAIEVLEAVKFILKDYTDEMEEAFSMAISALKAQDAAGDTISRRAAVDAVEWGITYARAINTCTGETKELFKVSNYALKEAAKRIKELPSAQPKHDISKANFLCPICGAEMEVAVSEWEGK